MENKQDPLSLDSEEFKFCKICRAPFGSPFRLILHLYEHLSKTRCVDCNFSLINRKHSDDADVSKNETANTVATDNFNDDVWDDNDAVSEDTIVWDGGKEEEFLKTDPEQKSKHVPSTTDDVKCEFVNDEIHDENCSLNATEDRNISNDTVHSTDDTSVIVAKIKGKKKRKNNETVGKSGVCPVCGKSFASKSYLKQHVRSHEEKKKFICAKCGDSFEEKKLLQSHKLTHAKIKRENGEKPHLCTICGMSFRLHCVLREHLASHSETRNYNCAECGKSFKSSWSLGKHRRRHREKTNFCDQCPKSFVTPKELRLHIRIHTGEKPFSCPICEKSFVQSSALQTHKLIHSNARPHKCDICGKAFTQSSALKKHSALHSSDRPFVCTICGRGLTDEEQLILHITRHETRKKKRTGRATRAREETEQNNS